MRVAIFSDTYYPSINGVSTSIWSLIKGLRGLGHEVALVVPRVDETSQSSSDPGFVRFALDSLVFPLLKDNRVGFPWPLKCWRRLGDFAPQIVHIQTPFAVGLYGRCYARWHHIPWLFTHHTRFEEYVHYLPLPSRVVRGSALALARFFWKGSGGVVVPSKQLESLIRKQGMQAPSCVIPTGIDWARFSGGEGQQVRRELGLASSDMLLLYVGRLAREKSIEVLLEVLAKVRQRLGNTYLALVGDGPARDYLVEQTRLLGLENWVRFLSWRPRERLKHYFAAASCLVFASVTETQGLVVLEAQASGCPVVAVKSPGINDAVVDGQGGFLVEPGDIELFADRVCQLINNDSLREVMSKVSQQQAREHSIEAMARDMQAWYTQALDGISKPNK